jgi:hypothetical protein
MWFLKRADHLSLEAFRNWWLGSHVELVLSLQKPYLHKYKVSIREDNDTLPGNTEHEFEWDGCAEQWFATEADYRAVYGKEKPSESREDSVKNVSRMSRIIVRETEII